MLQALGAAMDPWLLKRYLRYSLNRDVIKSQDVNTIIASVAANPQGHYLAWRHIKAYWPQIEALYVNESLSISDLILSIVPDYFITKYDYLEVRFFFFFQDQFDGLKMRTRCFSFIEIVIKIVSFKSISCNLRCFRYRNSLNDTTFAVVIAACNRA